MLAARRAEVDRLNTACQELLAARGRLGPERLQVEDRQLAVGDRVVCGHNAIAELGVANGSRGTITALDPHARTLTLRLDGTDGREVTLPRSLSGRPPAGERNRRVDLAYATTGHRAQGLTRGRALVRLTGTRGRQLAVCPAVPGPPGHPPVRGGRPRTPGRRRAGPARSGAARRLRCSSPRPCRGLAARPWPSTPPAARTSSGCPRRSCGPSGTGSAGSSTRPPATAAASWPGPPPTASRPSRPWPPTSSPPAASRPACFAGCGAAATSRPSAGWAGGGHPAGRPGP